MNLVFVWLDPARVLWADVSFAAPLSSCHSSLSAAMTRETADALLAERNERRVNTPNRATHVGTVNSNPLRLVAIDHIIKPAIRARHLQKQKILRECSASFNIPHMHLLG